MVKSLHWESRFVLNYVCVYCSGSGSERLECDLHLSENLCHQRLISGLLHLPQCIKVTQVFWCNICKCSLEPEDLRRNPEYVGCVSIPAPWELQTWERLTQLSTNSDSRQINIYCIWVSPESGCQSPVILYINLIKFLIALLLLLFIYTYLIYLYRQCVLFDCNSLWMIICTKMSNIICLS